MTSLPKFELHIPLSLFYFRSPKRYAAMQKKDTTNYDTDWRFTLASKQKPDAVAF
jgi:hypothetical protein